MKFLLTLLGTCSIVACWIVFLLLVHYIFLPYYCEWWFKKNKNIRSIVIPMSGKLGKTAFKDITIELNRQIKKKVSGNLNRIKSIATSIGPDGMCYITIWYIAKGCSYPEAESEAIGAFERF